MVEAKSEEKSQKPNWVTIKPAELEKIVVELGKQGKLPAEIGMILRDQHGVPKAKLLGKRVAEILKEHNIQFKEEKEILQDKIKVLETHIKDKSHDYTAKRSLTKKLWTMHKLNA